MDISSYQKWIKEIDTRTMRRHLEEFCQYEKLSGEPDALRAVRYIERELETSGIACQVLTFPAFLSNPVESGLWVGDRFYESRPRSFSGVCNGLEAELVFDESTECPGATELEKERFCQTVRGKIVVGYGFDECYGKTLEAFGAAGWIQVWRSGEPLIHEDTAGAVWGTPDLDSRFLLLHMPVVEVNLDTGQALVERIRQAKEPVRAKLTVHVDSGVREVALPVAEIQGASEEFVLLSCHYDTWYQGAFDNCTANAAALEIARVLKRHQGQLKRSVRIAWWPDHSNGRYMGSAWYCDHYFRELHRNCVACLNSDLIGVSGVDIMGVKTTGAEGEGFLRKLLAVAAPGVELAVQRIGRGADQSFFGADIPYHINPRLEARNRPCATPGPGNDFWHTAEDTFDKIDFANLKTDTDFLGLLTFAFAVEERLPLDAEGYFDRWMGELARIRAKAEDAGGADGSQGSRAAGNQGNGADRGQDNGVAGNQSNEAAGTWDNGAAGTRDLADVVQGLETLEKTLEQVRGAVAAALERCASGEDPGTYTAAVRRVFGCLNRLFQSSGSPYAQDTAFAYGPLHLLGESARIRQSEASDALGLFAHTTFVRQCNRMGTELEALTDFCNQLQEPGRKHGSQGKNGQVP